MSESARYANYLKSTHWKDFKKKYAKSNPTTCLVCGRGRAQLHHISYANLNRETFDDVTPLCAAHHRKVHRALDDLGWPVTRSMELIRSMQVADAYNRSKPSLATFLETAYEYAVSSPFYLGDKLTEFRTESYPVVITFFFELQRMSGFGIPFFIPRSAVGAVMGCGPTSVGLYCSVAKRDKFLVSVRKSAKPDSGKGRAEAYLFNTSDVKNWNGSPGIGPRELDLISCSPG